MSTIITKDLCVRFKDTMALDKVNIEIEENTIVGLIGRNGAGKTTFMKTAAGYLRPTSGEIKVFGEAPFDHINALSNTCFMDDDRYDESVNISQILNLSMLYYKNFNKKMAEKLLEYFEISKNKKFKKLSKGTKTLVSLVMAVCCRCPLTMLDEPTLGLDASHRKELMSLILKDYEDFPRTIIISSHLITELEGMMEQVILIDRGRLVFKKDLDEVQNYALYLTGAKSVLESLTAGRKILSKSELGDHLTLGLENNFTKPELQRFKENAIDITPMNVQDVCVNLTQMQEGGILNAIR